MVDPRSVPPSAPSLQESGSAERPLNWRSPLGCFWQDLRAIGSVIGARRVHYLEKRVERLENEIKRLLAKTAEPDGDS